MSEADWKDQHTLRLPVNHSEQVDRLGNIERKKIDPRGAFVIKGDSTRPPSRARRPPVTLSARDYDLLVELKDEAREQLRGAVEALLRYGDHDRSCGVRLGQACSCGFAKAAGKPTHPGGR